MLALLASCPVLAGVTIGLIESQKQCTTNQWGAIRYNTQVSIDFKGSQGAFKTNQVVELVVRIRNLSTNEDYGVGVDTALTSSPSLSFVVASPSGKDISPKRRESSRLSGGTVWVGPGQTDGFSFRLTDLVKVEETGTYKVLISTVRSTPDRRKSYEIMSNWLYVSVVP